MRSATHMAAAMLAFGFVACAPRVNLRVAPAAIAELPLERKLALLDAENELLAAVDLRDAAEERWLDARASGAEARRRRSEAEDQRAKARKAKEPLELHEAAVLEAEARVRWAGAQEDIRLFELRAQDTALQVAEAKHELARANEVEAAALPGAKDVKVLEFRKQVERLQAALEERTAKVAKVQKEKEPLRQAWMDARAALLKASGGGLGSAWTTPEK